MPEVREKLSVPEIKVIVKSYLNSRFKKKNKTASANYSSFKWCRSGPKYRYGLWKAQANK